MSTKEKIAASIKTILTEQKFNDKTVLTHIYNSELNMNVQAEILLGLISTVNR